MSVRVLLSCVLAGILGFHPLPAADTDSRFTCKFPNGRYWRNLTPKERVVYVVGLRDGEGFASDELLSWWIGFPVEEMLLALELFFDEPANARIPVIIAVMVARLKADGASPDTLEKLVASYRLSSSVGCPAAASP